MTWESWVGAALGAALGIWLGKLASRPRRPYRPRNRRYALHLIRAAVTAARGMTDRHAILVLSLDQRRILWSIPRRYRFDTWHAAMVLEVMHRRSRELERIEAREYGHG